MILNCMLATGYGGLEKLFLDEIEMLPMAGLPARGLVARNSQLARYARERHLEFDQAVALSDWDPISVAAARRVLRQRAPELVMCVGRKAHRLMARSVRKHVPIVPMVQKRRFDRTLPYSGVLAAAEHRRLTLIADGVPEDKIIVIPNAVRLPAQPKTDYRERAGEPVKIVALGRLHEKKGFGVLIAAVKLLTARGIACSCAIAGEGPERQTLEARITSDAVAARVSLPGWTDNVPEFLATGDIFVLPSFQEDFPLAVLDAMASGMPIVASAIDGPKDFLVDGETALLVPPGDPSALADALALLIADASLRAKLGRSARRIAVETYSFEAIGRRLASALRNVLAGRAISSGL
jgi:glycosyltransferase involved in cell wall biosynthesis